MGLCCLRTPEPVTMTVVPVAPPCFDASDNDALEEDWLEAQMQETFHIDHAEAAMSDEPGGQNPLTGGTRIESICPRAQSDNRTVRLYFWGSYSL